MKNNKLNIITYPIIKKIEVGNVCISKLTKKPILITKPILNLLHYSSFDNNWQPVRLLLLSNEEINVGDWYYISLEHDLPKIQYCKKIDKTKEYWLDDEYKYAGMSDTIYGCHKIITATPKLEGVECFKPKFINEWIMKQYKEFNL